jgi:DNA-binding NarL/FixJ family response regulator
MPSNTELNIVIADDHAIFRRGLRMVIEAEPRLKVVAEAADGESALALIETHQPQIAVLDMDMPPPDGLGVARFIREKCWPIAIIFLTMHKSEAAFNVALDLGVKGYILKDGAASEVISCIKAVAAGQSFISPVLSGHLLNRHGRAQQQPGLDELTPAERRVLRLLAEMKTNKEIAEALFVSVRTVEHHRANICSKLGLNGAHALLTFALAHKLEI